MGVYGHITCPRDQRPPIMAPKHIAILGGGLSGLSSAFHLSRRFPSSRITLLEQHDRLGGWVRSERVDVEDTHGARAKILLESGPRTLRPNQNAILEMVSIVLDGYTCRGTCTPFYCF